MSTTVDESAATRVIFDYMTERKAWERAAFKQSRGRGRKSLAAGLESEAQIQAGYSDLLARFCAPRVIALNLRYHYGDPPTVDIERTRIVSIQRDRGAIRVRTEESNRPGFGAETYEYELIDVGGVLKISERRGHVGSRRSIRDVW